MTMLNENNQEQSSFETETSSQEASQAPHMIARINAVAVKMVYPFMAQDDIRTYLNAINIRPLEDGSVMIVATNGHKYLVVRDPNGYAEKEINVHIQKDALKHATSAKNTLDVLSNGSAIFSNDSAEPLFIQPKNSVNGEKYPRIERVASVIGYKEGISGEVNPKYLYDALEIGKAFGQSIRFFTRDSDSPLNFVITGMGELECFGGIMKMREAFSALPEWFPLPTEPNSLDEI